MAPGLSKHYVFLDRDAGAGEEVPEMCNSRHMMALTRTAYLRLSTIERMSSRRGAYSKAFS